MFSHAFILGFLDFVVPNLFLSSFCYLIYYWLSVRYEQSVRFQEEDHDGRRRMYLPRCSSSGTASVLRPLTVRQYRLKSETTWQKRLKTASTSVILCSRDSRNRSNSWEYRDATSLGRLSPLEEPSSASSLCTASLASLLA